VFRQHRVHTSAACIYAYYEFERVGRRRRCCYCRFIDDQAPTCGNQTCEAARICGHYVCRDCEPISQDGSTCKRASLLPHSSEMFQPSNWTDRSTGSGRSPLSETSETSKGSDNANGSSTNRSSPPSYPSGRVELNSEGDDPMNKRELPPFDRDDMKSWAAASIARDSSPTLGKNARNGRPNALPLGKNVRRGGFSLGENGDSDAEGALMLQARTIQPMPDPTRNGKEDRVERGLA
jgi:hypothetical protein